MPIYEYQCANGHDFEKLVPMSTPEDEKETTQCPDCAAQARRHMSLGSFILKGQWFKQGY